ncbi:phosphodiesterase [Mycobacterium sherrisii]|uniref:Phosphodiesterase n=2 Tax=Mycobacterium sherrisii TaxID=243061 RepID=A0A1E3T7K6_9MYCO|nr:phosphodiesterase [Mycobacterium sherrisii]MCV7029055.1 phosphodiesterase [Mycobacterium sherrisii]MEC4763223.1 phosphodiesterase [Mycobacterium sherrisii]ODR10367.1 phosphodiesterase [Mycobacterium sherrisii]ORW75693.1 phosphodiesterase [Mycobacterium sherrisii]
MSVADVVALPFRVGSAMRGRRFFHPVGVLAHGRAERVAPAQCGLPLPSSDVVVRVSKAVGTPGSLPDLIGLAIRADAPQSCARPWDILLVSAGSGVLTRALALRPVTSWTGQPLSNLMPLRYRDSPWWLRARIETDIRGNGLSLDDVERRISHGGIDVALDQARGRGDFTPLARLHLSTVLDPQQEDVSFDPVVNTPPGLTLYPGWLADLRAQAYQRSREGRLFGLLPGHR